RSQASVVSLLSRPCCPIATAPSPTSTLSLHDALPISVRTVGGRQRAGHHHRAGRHAAVEDFARGAVVDLGALREEDSHGQHHGRSEEHTSELQSREKLVCRLLLEKKTRHRKARWPQQL